MEKISTSRNQEQFWLLQKIYKDNSAYNIASVFEIKGSLNLPAFEKAVITIIRKHEVLQMFVIEDNLTLQGFVDVINLQFKIPVITLDSDANREKLQELISREVNAPFQLTEWPLFRIKLFNFEGIYFLTIVFHHILVDLRSKEIFSNELSDYYSIYNREMNAKVEIVPDRYSEYVCWQQPWLDTEEAQIKLSSFNEDISKGFSPLELPSDFARPKTISLEGKRHYFSFDILTSAEIADRSKLLNVNTFAFLLSAFAVFLNRISNQSSFIIGVPLTNRKNENFKDTFGCFVNIVPVFMELSPEETIEQVIKKVRTQLLIAHRRQEIPFLDINDLFRSKHNTSKGLFQAGFASEPPMQLHLEDLQVSPVKDRKEGSQLDLFLTFWEQAGEIEGYLEYSTQLFQKETVERFKNIYTRIVHAFTGDLNVPVIDIDILPKADAEQLIEWNHTDAPYNRNICLHEKLEEQADKTPYAVALIFENEHVTYAEVELHANRLANYLISNGVGVEDRIGVCQERSLEMLISIFAIHKAGATYVPIDPEFPSERMNMILEDSEPRFILTKLACDFNIPGGFSKVYVDDIFTNPLSLDPTRPHTLVNSKHLAYIIYTSGSTGKPKGVMIEHHSVVNKLEWMQQQHPLEPGDTLILKTPVTFDVSVWELFWWYFNGARLAILPPKGEKDPETITRVVEQNKVTLIIFVPSMFSSFVNHVKANSSSRRLKSLKWIVQIGEALTPQLVNSFNELLNESFNPLMVNTYGPAEATVAVTYYNCPKETGIRNIYIGKPISNTKIVIINNKGKIQPIGIPGELAILGVNLSRGYVNRPELNREKFAEIEYLDGQRHRAYKTGDLARWLDNGNIDFIGRVDNQVKIRGYRIELGDIEAVLHQCSQVKSAAVIVDRTNVENPYLVGYVTLLDNKQCNAESIKGFLHTKLPDYMIPAHIMILDEMPLNRSEKIDRKALPKPVLMVSDTYIAPAGFYELELSNIWKNVLNLPMVGISNNFFDVGGNSLLAINVTSAIKLRLNISIEPIKLMEYPNIKELAKYLMAKDNKQSPAEKSISVSTSRKQNFMALREKRK
jgi:amino acid adenylation domain-containing protein